MWYQVKERLEQLSIYAVRNISGKGYDIFKIQGQM